MNDLPVEIDAVFLRIDAWRCVNQAPNGGYPPGFLSKKI
jgi:hypothetical protein